MTEDEQLDIRLEDDRIVIFRPRQRYRIKDLVSDLAHEELSTAFDWGPDQGREGAE